MRILSYKAIIPNSDGVVPELDREGYMTPQYMELVEDYISSIRINGRCAFLYVGGAVCTASEARNTEHNGIIREPAKQSSIVIKELAAYSMHKWIGKLADRDRIVYANINGNTCASSLHAVYEAQELLTSGKVDEVLIVAEEKTAYNTIRIFNEHDINIKIGEGLAILHLSKDGDDITDCKWEYEYNRNPFGVTESGYTKVDTESDYVKPHGTYTEVNESAEDKVFSNREQIRYKQDIGHTQGASGLIELCMVLDSEVKGKVLCVASGLGGFYGSCIVNKK